MHLLIGVFRAQELVYASQVFQDHAVENFLCQSFLLRRVEPVPGDVSSSHVTVFGLENSHMGNLLAQLFQNSLPHLSFRHFIEHFLQTLHLTRFLSLLLCLLDNVHCSLLAHTDTVE